MERNLQNKICILASRYGFK